MISWGNKFTVCKVGYPEDWDILRSDMMGLTLSPNLKPDTMNISCKNK